MSDTRQQQLIQQIRQKVQDKIRSPDDPWILETPDNGLTVTKRRFSEEEKFYLNNVNGKWYNYQDALAAVRQRDREALLREQHASLRDAYDVYLQILALVDPGSVSDEHD